MMLPPLLYGAFDFGAAISGEDLVSTLGLILLIVYFLWLYAWAKKQVGQKFGLLIAVVFTYLLFFLYPELLWLPFILFLVATFGKDFLDRVPKPK